MRIQLNNLHKRFGAFHAIRGVSLDLPSGELAALLGPSGSGKTTLLRMIAGLERPDDGVILFDGEDASDASIAERRVGFVFQHYALFRHMTVFENVAFGLRVRPRRRRPDAATIRARVTELLRLVQLERLAERYPAQLSGGQRQRVALARALAVEPTVLLLDEPFGALDARVREELRRWLRRLHDEIPITSVLVTHDQEDALEVADRIVVLNEGVVEQVGAPAEVYHHPATPFVCEFIGTVNMFHERVNETGEQLDPDALHRVNGAAGPHGRNGTNGAAHDTSIVRTRMYARPHEIDLTRTRGSERAMPGRVKRVNAAGPLVRVEVDVAGGGGLRVELSHARYQELGLRAGDEVFAEPRDIRVFDAGAGI